MPPPSDPRTTEPLLWFAGAGHERRSGPDYDYNARTRSDLRHVVLQLTLAGAGYYHRPPAPRTLLTPGRAFIDVIPGPYHYGWASGTYEFVFLCLRGHQAETWARRLQHAHGHVLDFGAGSSVADTLLSITRHGHSQPLSDRYLASGQFYGLLMQVLSVLTRSRAARTPLATRTVTLISQHASDPTLNVTRLARTLDCSREHLAREFRAVMGVSPLDYLVQHRVRLAARSLRAGEHKLEVVARDSGFSSAAYLCRVFRKAVGVTPRQFRDRPWLVVP